MSAKYLLYHAECYDGFGSAWAFWNRYKQDMTYIPVFYGESPPPEIPNDAEVFIVDFSYPRDELLKMQKKFSSLVLLDHHISAKKNLEGLPFAHFNMNKSGAVLAWEYLFPNQAVPLLLQYVMDRDLWLFELEKSRYVHEYIASFDLAFEDWQNLAIEMESNFKGIVAMGERIWLSTQKKIKMICANQQWISFSGYEIPCVNTSILASEVGHALLEEHPQALFSVSWYRNSKNKISTSLRSRGDFDVSLIAQKWGGGGHRAAAGCLLPSEPNTLSEP